MIGFLLFSYYEADEDYAKESWWIERFMIDHRFQQKGYGSQAMEAAIEWFRQAIQAKELRISSVKRKIRSLNKCTKVLDLLQLESL